MIKKTETRIYRIFWTSWTTETVGTMQTTQKNHVNKIFELYNLKYPSPYKVRSFSHFSPIIEPFRII